jgi:hypothetical protein
MGIWQGFWLFFNSPVYSWWLSISAIFLNASWSLHNVIAWMKIKPFLSRPVSLTFITTVILIQPYWVVEIYANFAYFHGQNEIFLKTRPWEALCRDPWWIFTTVALFWTIKKEYEMSLKEIISISPRFGVMLLAMVLSIIFIVLDICSVTNAFKSTLPVGINPFWKLSFVFKCLTDSVVLDDFKTALDRLRAFKISRIGSFSQDTSDRRTWNDTNLINTWEEMEVEAQRHPSKKGALPSPDGTLVNASHFPAFKASRRYIENTKNEQIHRESVVSPDFVARDFCNTRMDPEDIVLSALETPSLRAMENAHVYNRRDTNPLHLNLQDQRQSFESEDDYASALRECQGQSPPTTPLKKSFSRQSRPP